ncbi:MAG: helix-turn-helix domain-containing protein [Deltaproteobacteria bacterium]|nr:MAG: helix-turn-helix domain-containing protein [Deltaproteobacteria bacterium]
MNQPDSPRGGRGIVRPRAVPRPFEHGRIAPGAGLAPWVSHLWWVRWRVDAPFVQFTVPYPVVHVVFEDGQAMVHGPMSTRFRRELVGEGGVFGVHFRPGAFRPVLGESLRALRDQRWPARRVFGEGVDHVAARLADGAPAEVEVQEWLRAVLPDALDPELATLVDLAERMMDGEVDLGVAQVAGALGVSERTLQRRFMDALGWTPREVLLRHRVHEALHCLDQPVPPPLAELALTLGYCDQAHFSREFKRMVGLTPGAYVRER